MYRKKIGKKIIGTALCLCLLGSEIIPVSAQEVNVKVEQAAESSEQVSVESLTPEVPVQVAQTDASTRYPVGGVAKTEYLELPENAEGVETFSGETSGDELLTVEAQEGVNAGFSSNYGYSTLSTTEKKFIIF